MRMISVNTANNGPIMAFIKPSTKEFFEVENGNGINAADIKSVNVILDAKLQQISPEKFWSYDSIVNVLGSDD